jgi:hypothetical protein
VRSLDIATQLAVSDRNRIAICNFVLITARNVENEPISFGFTDFGEDVSVNIIDGLTGGTINHTYYGDNSPISELDSIPMSIGLEVSTTNVVLNPFHPVVSEMYRGNVIRNAPVQIHRGFLSPESMLLVAPPRCRRLGFVNKASEEIGGVGSESRLTLEVVSITRELTRSNPAKRSDETQRRRNGDRFRRYTGTADKWPIWWGEEKSA